MGGPTAAAAACAGVAMATLHGARAEGSAGGAFPGAAAVSAFGAAHARAPETAPPLPAPAGSSEAGACTAGAAAAAHSTLGTQAALALNGASAPLVVSTEAAVPAASRAVPAIPASHASRFTPAACGCGPSSSASPAPRFAPAARGGACLGGTEQCACWRAALARTRPVGFAPGLAASQTSASRWPTALPCARPVGSRAVQRPGRSAPAACAPVAGELRTRSSGQPGDLRARLLGRAGAVSPARGRHAAAECGGVTACTAPHRVCADSPAAGFCSAAPKAVRGNICRKAPRPRPEPPLPRCAAPVAPIAASGVTNDSVTMPEPPPGWGATAGKGIPAAAITTALPQPRACSAPVSRSGAAGLPPAEQLRALAAAAGPATAAAAGLGVRDLRGSAEQPLCCRGTVLAAASGACAAAAAFVERSAGCVAAVSLTSTRLPAAVALPLRVAGRCAAPPCCARRPDPNLDSAPRRPSARGASNARSRARRLCRPVSSSGLQALESPCPGLNSNLKGSEPVAACDRQPRMARQGLSAAANCLMGVLCGHSRGAASQALGCTGGPGARRAPQGA